MKRFIQRLEEFEKSLNTLKEVLDLNEDKNDIVRDSIIKRFEYTFECAWKALEAYLYFRNINDFENYVKNIFKTAHHHRIIKSVTIYLQMTDARNKTSHEYDEMESKDIVEKIREKYFENLEDLYKELKSKDLDN